MSVIEFAYTKYRDMMFPMIPINKMRRIKAWVHISLISIKEVKSYEDGQG